MPHSSLSATGSVKEIPVRPPPNLPGFIPQIRILLLLSLKYFLKNFFTILFTSFDLYGLAISIPNGRLSGTLRLVNYFIAFSAKVCIIYNNCFRLYIPDSIKLSDIFSCSYLFFFLIISEAVKTPPNHSWLCQWP
jgi:hypothetical protein